MKLFQNFMDVINSLIHIGLTNNEAKLYSILLVTGESKAGELSKKAGFNRTTTYDVLHNLIEKGFAAFSIKSKTKYFIASNPEKIINFIKEKELIVHNLVPLLKKMSSQKDENEEITFYKGFKGIKSAFEDIIISLKNNDTNRVFDSDGKFVEKMPYFFPHFIKSLEEKKINVKHIINEGIDIKPSKTTKVKYVKTSETSNTSIDIYSDKMLIILWSEFPKAVMIKNNSLSKMMKYYFEQVWKK
jgi:sugar-specific transcriptional regulator TrmB